MFKSDLGAFVLEHLSKKLLSREHLSGEHLTKEHLFWEHLSWEHLSREHMSEEHWPLSQVTGEHMSQGAFVWGDSVAWGAFDSGSILLLPHQKDINKTG